MIDPYVLEISEMLRVQSEVTQIVSERAVTQGAVRRSQ